MGVTIIWDHQVPAGLRLPVGRRIETVLRLPVTLVDADVLIIGSPTYYFDVCGHVKNFIDRTYSLYHDRKLAGRKGVAVAVHAHNGGTRTIQTLEGFLSTHEFSSLGSVKGTGYHEGDILKDTDALTKAQKTADKIVRLVKSRHT